MRFSIVSGALAGALASGVSAVPAPQQQGGQQSGQQAGGMSFKKIPWDPANMGGRPKSTGTFSNRTMSFSANAIAAGSNCPPRIEWDNASSGEKTQFVQAIKTLFTRPTQHGVNGQYFPGSRNRWEDLVSVHQQMTGQVHSTPIFLPWHRYFLAIFESLIRDEGGYTGRMLWWDETKWAGNFHSASIFWQGMDIAPLADSNGNGYCLGGGNFGGTTLHIGPGPSNSDHCLARGIKEGDTANCNQGFVDYCNSFGSYSQMWPCAEQGPHAWGHNGIGPTMADVYSSPGDPMFFMHHAFVDRNWWHWQMADPANRNYQLCCGVSGTSGTFTSNGIRGPVGVGDMMNTCGGFLRYSYDY